MKQNVSQRSKYFVRSQKYVLMKVKTERLLQHYKESENVSKCVCMCVGKVFHFTLVRGTGGTPVASSLLSTLQVD